MREISENERENRAKGVRGLVNWVKLGIYADKGTSSTK